MLSLHFLLVASHCHFLSVLDLCVFVCCCLDFPCVFCADTIAHMCGPVALSKEGFRFSAFLHAPAVVSKLFQVRRRKHNVHGKQKNKPACGDPWRGGSHASPCSAKKMKRQYVDNHHPPPSYTATERDCRRTKRPYKMAIRMLQGAVSSWEEHFIRRSPGHCVPDGP